MSAVFADTFYWIAFTNVQDFAHERANGPGMLDFLARYLSSLQKL
jgi:hypothetical protein